MKPIRIRAAAVLLLLAGATFHAEGSGALTVSPVPVAAAVKTHFGEQKLAQHILADPGYWTWCFSVMQWKDGKYHGYYARWPKETGFGGWMTHCEIAHAVADKPEGPFKTTGTVIASRNLEGWDVVNAHNPYVCVAGDTICLYYISNNLKGALPVGSGSPASIDDWLKKNRGAVRNSQCIGVAVATDPAGPFVRAKEVVVAPHGRFKNIAVNPAVVYRDGQFTMVMKGDDATKEEVFRIQLVGRSDRPEGPFHFEEVPVFDTVQSEDASLWYDGEEACYYMVCHIMGSRDLALSTSQDGLRWRPADHPVLMKKEIPLDDGTVWKPKRVERPFVLTDAQGIPVMVYLAVFDENQSANIALPVKASARRDG